MATDLLLIRHAPSRPPGRLYGRTDAAAEIPGSEQLTAVRRTAGRVDHWLSSPAVRCRETLAAIWGADAPARFDDRLWEQDFGQWDGLAHGEVPDLGPLNPDQLCQHRPPDGESFADMCERVHPALRDAVAGRTGERVAIVAHAGVIRAAIGLALGSPAAALAFEVETLSLTHIRVLSGDTYSIVRTNWHPSLPCDAAQSRAIA